METMAKPPITPPTIAPVGDEDAELVVRCGTLVIPGKSVETLSSSRTRTQYWRH
jgi:hypothetical protein